MKIISYFTILFCLYCCLLPFDVNGNGLNDAENDMIKYLPGLNHILNFKHYSGYVEGTQGDHLHYWFVESLSNPQTDPVILWLNGGPGCSSLDGLFNELGPYQINEDGTQLILNEFSWNKAANVLFLEAPACVGFSYRDSGKCATSDDETSLSNYNALKSFFKKFPQYRNNAFYITGESYGGIYIPTLSVRVLEGNSTYPLNFKGYAIGNGLSSFELNDDSIIFFAYYHGLIGQNLWKDLVDNCCEEKIESKDKCDFRSTDSKMCRRAVEETMDIVYNEGLNMYNLYGKCLHPKSEIGASNNGTSRYFYDKNILFASHRPQMSLRTNSIKNLKLDPPCTDATNMRTYLNNPDVQTAAHVKNIKWDVCSDEVNAEYRTQYKTMRKQYEYLTKHVRGLIYNGDIDMACNFLGDEWFAESLGLKVIENRRMWHYNDQVAGFVKKFYNLDVLTIRGAGHMVPLDKPGPALKMIFSFINGKKY